MIEWQYKIIRGHIISIRNVILNTRWNVIKKKKNWELAWNCDTRAKTCMCGAISLYPNKVPGGLSIFSQTLPFLRHQSAQRSMATFCIVCTRSTFISLKIISGKPSELKGWIVCWINVKFFMQGIWFSQIEKGFKSVVQWQIQVL